jgi:hypothetical protein
MGEIKNMNLRISTGLLLFPVVATIALAASAAAQVVVVGTGDPNIDVPAVQTAVNQGGEVILKGHFSFDRPPTIATALPGFPPATILVSRAVAITGTQDGDDEMASIEAGTIPFYVEAPGAPVSIQGLRFVLPKRNAVFVYAASGLVIANCRIEGMEPVNQTATAIAINTSGDVPTPSRPGHPENISGTLLVVNNDIDVGGTTQDSTLGVVIFSAGVPGAEVEAYVSENRISNTTEPPIGLRRIGGRAYIERNVLNTGSVVGPPGRPQVIRVANTGSYLVAHNSIDCGWVRADVQGIGVFSQIADWPIERAVVVDNDVTMSAPVGTVFGAESAGIMIEGFAQDNVVQDNRIRGSARAALSASVFNGGIPTKNRFVLNRFDDFEASLADVFVDADVMNTLIVGPGTVEDHGEGTRVLPLQP